MIAQSSRYPCIKEYGECVSCGCRLVTIAYPFKYRRPLMYMCPPCRATGKRYVRWRGSDGLYVHGFLSDEISRHESDTFKSRFEVIEGDPL